MSEGFYCDDWRTPMLFFRICRRYKIPDTAVKLKLEIFRKLVARKKAKYIPHPKEFLQGCNVINIKKENLE